MFQEILLHQQARCEPEDWNFHPEGYGRSGYQKET